MTLMLLKEANLAERTFSLKFYSIRPKSDGVGALCKLADEDARKVVVQQAGLNQLGVFIRYKRRASDETKDQNLPAVWLPETTSLKEALQGGSSLAGWAGLARKADGRLRVRTHAPRDSQNLIEARRAFSPASTLPPSPSLGVVGKDSYRLRGVPVIWLFWVQSLPLGALDGLLSLFVVPRDPIVKGRSQLLQTSHLQSG